MAAIYAVYTSPNHPPIPNHLPTLIVTPHGQPSNILYSYLHTNFGDLCVAKLFPPRQKDAKGSASDPGHASSSGSRIVRCEASRNLKWSITNTGVISPIYKLSLPSPDSPDLPLFQISKPNPNAAFWSMFYFAYAGHNIPPKRIEFGKIQKNPPGPNGGGTRISITGKTPEEKAVWQTLGEGNEDCVEWVVLCAALNLLDDEIIKAAEKNPVPPAANAAAVRAPVSLRDPGPAGGPAGNPPQQQQQHQQQQQQQQRPPPGPAQQRPPMQVPPPQQQQRPPQQSSPGQRPPQGFPNQQPPLRGFPQPGQPAQGGFPQPGQPAQGFPPAMRQAPSRNGTLPPQGLMPGAMPFAARPPQMQIPQQQAMSPQPQQVRRF